MEVDEIQMRSCKLQRIGNGRNDTNKIETKGNGQYPNDEEDLQVQRNGGDLVTGGVVGRFCGWPSSRIVRVSRASGGKDRHSKVWTSKGLRDRRVRLSVATAIQFYDLQDRLGYDQPSKAVEWLLKAAASSIAELPSLNTSFPDTPKQISDEKRPSDQEHGFDSAEVEFNDEPNHQHQQHNVSLSKSACSSTSETSKGSASLSLSRSESRMKARERARGRAAEKEKEKENEPRIGMAQNHISQNSSFTELLTGGINTVGNSTTTPNGSSHQNPQNQSPRHWPSSTPMDYFSTGLVNPSSSRTHHSSGWGNTISQFNVNGDQNQFSFVQENLVPIVSSSTATGGDYNLNFSITSGLAGFNRGTLQSNSPSFLPHHLQRFSPIDGSNIPFFIGTASPNAVAVENHHHLYPPGSLQLCYGDGGRHSDQKGKGKN